MASSDRIDELKRKFDENPRRYFAPLANEFRKSGDFEQAILICQEFLPQQPGHMSGHIVYGQALYESERLDDARGVFETALSLDPENLIALRHLGDIASRQGDAPTARRWYERVLEADPRNDEIHALIGALAAPPAAASHAPPPPPPAAEPSLHETVPTESGAQGSEPGGVAEHGVTPELLDLDVSLPDARPAEPVAADERDADHALQFFGGTTISGIEPTPETSELMPSVEGRTDGFEAGEFTAPETPIAPTPGLQSSYEVETGVHPVFFAPLPGLERPETTVEPAPALETTSAFPELDEPLTEDRGDVVPPHGDPIAESAPAPSAAGHDETLLDFDMPLVDEPPRDTVPSSASRDLELPQPTTESLDTAPVGDSTSATIPAELPPEVIAAEAELIEAGMSVAQPEAAGADAETSEGESVGGDLAFLDVGEPAREDAEESVAGSAEPVLESEPEPAPERPAEPVAVGSREITTAEPKPFVTETMAELYLKQGFRREALAVYEQLSAASPSDQRLSAKVAGLRSEIAAPPKRTGPPVREFFARFAARRPGERGAAAAPPAFDDFGPADDVDSASSADPPFADEGGDADHIVASATPATSAPVEQKAGGTIDALFGNQSVGAPEDSAASALAQAFGTGGESTPIAGNPARPATGELTLDSVFREGGSRGQRTSQGFSFDQFFSQNVDGERTSGGGDATGDAPAPGEPAERTEDDIEQFNSWLQGLKQR
ncbi:MAG TPA: tetratricopeptide repeat protein [Candidatus Limnocylindrales bacterium]